MANPSLRQVYREHTNDSTDYSRGTILYDKKEKKIYVGGDLMYPHFSLGDVVPASFTIEDIQNETVNIDATKAEAYLNSIKPFDFDKVEIQTMIITLGAAGHGQVLREGNLISFIKENASTEIEAIKNEVLLSYPTASYINITSHNIDDYNPVISYFYSSYTDASHHGGYDASGLRLPSGFINYSKENLKNIFDSLGLWNTSGNVFNPVTFARYNDENYFYVSTPGGSSSSYQLEELESVFGITLNFLASTDSWEFTFNAYGMSSTPYVDVYDATDTQLASSVSITSSYLESIYNGNWSPACANHNYNINEYYSKIDLDNNKIIYNALLDGYQENLIETWNLYNYGIEITWDQTNIGKLVLAYTPSYLVNGRDGTVPEPTAHNQVLTSDGWADGVPVDIDEFEAPTSALEIESSNNFTATPTLEFLQFIKDYGKMDINGGDKINILYHSDWGNPEASSIHIDKYIRSNDAKYQAINNIVSTVITDYSATDHIVIIPNEWAFTLNSVSIYDSTSALINYTYPEGVVLVDQDKFKDKLASEFGVTSYDPNVYNIDFNIQSGQTESDWTVTYNATPVYNQNLTDWGVKLLEDIDYTDSSLYSKMSISFGNSYYNFNLLAFDINHNALYNHSSAVNPLTFNQDDLDVYFAIKGGNYDMNYNYLYTSLVEGTYHIKIELGCSAGYQNNVLENRGLENLVITDTSIDGSLVLSVIASEGKSGIVPAPDNRNQTLTSTGWQNTNTYIESAMTAFENNYIWIGTTTEFSNVNWDSSNPMMDADTGIIYHIIYVVEE